MDLSRGKKLFSIRCSHASDLIPKARNKGALSLKRQSTPLVVVQLCFERYHFEVSVTLRDQKSRSVDAQDLALRTSGRRRTFMELS